MPQAAGAVDLNIPGAFGEDVILEITRVRSIVLNEDSSCWWRDCWMDCHTLSV